MTRNSRMILLATTMLAGLAISTHDAAQAGPNGPSFSGGSISGFSSTRMDFNRIGGPGRALSRNDLRVVPVDVVKTTEKPKDTKNVGKNISKKDTNVARVSNPKFSTGGDNKPGVQNGTNLPINPNVTAERIDAAALAARLKIGPFAVDVPWGAGDGSFAWPEFWPGKTEQSQHDRTTVDDLQNGRVRGEPGSGGAPGGPDTSKTGQASQDGWIQGSFQPGGWWHVRSYDNRTDTVTDRSSSPTSRNRDGSVSRNTTTTVTSLSNSGRAGHSNETENYAANDPEIEGGPKDNPNTGRVRESNNRPGPRNSTGGENEDQIERSSNEETSGGENPPDSQPAGEGYYSARGMGRPDSICGPAGCWVGDHTSRRQILTRDPDGSTARTARRQSPGWASDPNPDGLGGGGNGERTGYTPENEGGGDIGGPGNPALEGLNVAL